MDKPISDQQRKALHLWFRQWAAAFAHEGVTMNLILNNLTKRGLEVLPTETCMKEQVWKVVSRAMTGNESTTKITNDDLEKIHLALTRWSSVEMNVVAPPFPSYENEDLQG